MKSPIAESSGFCFKTYILNDVGFLAISNFLRVMFGDIAAIKFSVQWLNLVGVSPFSVSTGAPLNHFDDFVN